MMGCLFGAACLAGSSACTGVSAALTTAAAAASGSLSAALLEVEDEGLRVSADATLALRALANLLTNAQQHGRGALRLEVRARGDEVAFVVEDGGPGLQAGDEERAFEKFFSRGAEGRSLGLGLALVRRIAEAHGGRAFAEPAGQAGARVGFSLPLAA